QPSASATTHFEDNQTRPNSQNLKGCLCQCAGLGFGVLESADRSPSPIGLQFALKRADSVSLDLGQILLPKDIVVQQEFEFLHPLSEQKWQLYLVPVFIKGLEPG